MKNFLLLCCLIMIISSCKKKRLEPEPIKETSTIAGVIYPANGAALVVLTNEAGVQVEAPVYAATGNFSFEKLLPGKYKLTIPASSSFFAPPVLEVVLQGGQYFSMGTIPLISSIRKYEVNGKLLPAGFGVEVKATDEKSGDVFIGSLTALGDFNFYLPDGDYKLTFTAKAPALAPAEVKIKVAGNDVSLGAYTCTNLDLGKIVGKFNPFGALATVTATNTQTGDVTSGIIARINGVFEFAFPKPGEYKISFTANIPYLAPASITTTVAAQKTSDIGSVVFVEDKDQRMISAKLGSGTALKYNPSCVFDKGILSFSLSRITVSSIQLGGSGSRVTELAVVIDNITGPGKYVIKGTGDSKMTLTETTTIPRSSTVWNVNGTKGSGEVEITNIDTKARTIRGTFKGDLTPVTTSTTILNRAVTDGVFFMNY